MPAHTGGPPKSSLADQQSIASSNATVTTFLNRRQPKSWMTGTSSKPSSRPVSNRQPATQTIQQQSAQNVLLSPAPSDAPSPAVSNPHDSPNPNPAALPSQTMANRLSRFPESEARFVYDLSADETDETVPPAQSHHLPRNIPAPVLSNNGTAVPTNPGASAAYVGPPVAQPSSVGSVNTSAPGGQGQLPRGSPTIVQNGPPPAKRRRTDPRTQRTQNMYAMFANKIDVHIQSCSELTSDVERPRLQLLREACSKEDVFFLALHQLFCLWSESPSSIQRYVLHGHVVIDRAFSIMESVLKRNQTCRMPTRSFFTQFPAPITSLIQPGSAPTAYTQAVDQVSTFLERLANYFPSLTNKLLSRRYPYMVHELAVGLGCHSPVLQGIFFTACRRRLGVVDGPLGTKMDNLFKHDQRRYASEGYNHGTEEYRKWSDNLVREYKSIIAQIDQIAAQAQAISSASPSVAQSPTAFQQATPLPVQILPSNAPPVQPTPSYALPSQSLMTYAQPMAHGQGYGHLVSPVAAPIPTLSYPGQGAPMPPYGQQNQPPQGQAYSSTAQIQYAHHQQQLQAGQREQQLQQQQLQQHHMQMQQMRQTHQLLQMQQHLQHPPPTFGPVVASPPPLEVSSFSPQLQQSAPPRISGVGNRPAPIAVPPASSRNLHVTVNGGPVAAPVLQYQQLAQQNPQFFNDRPLLPPQGFIIPRPEVPYDAYERKAVMMGLHQALARSPRRITKNEKPERFYQAPKSLPAGPSLVTPKNVLQRLRFEVTREELALASTASRLDGDLLPVAEHFDGSLRWRLRACKFLVPNKVPSEHQWVTLETSWPSNMLASCNGQVLEIRRSQHNGKDMAVELTDLIVCGTNEIQISLPEQHPESTHSRFMAVELLETLSHSEVVKLVWNGGVIPEDQTLQTIKSRLSGPTDDDGLIFSEPDLAIDLADPFSAVIFEIPTRGVACTHMECFDLETWLNTRPSKPPQKCRHGGDFPCGCLTVPEPSIPDKWRCPICLEDARPYSLRIDGFLLQVRRKLQAENKLQTKSMRVKPDGTWTVVVEEADDELDSDDEGPAVTNKPTAPPTVARRQEVEVIEID